MAFTAISQGCWKKAVPVVPHSHRNTPTTWCEGTTHLRGIPRGHPMGSSQDTCLPPRIAGDTAFSSSKFWGSKEPCGESKHNSQPCHCTSVAKKVFLTRILASETHDGWGHCSQVISNTSWDYPCLLLENHIRLAILGLCRMMIIMWYCRQLLFLLEL